MSALADALRPSLLEASLGRALGILDALIDELGGRRSDAPFAWSAGGSAAWLWPLVRLANELEAIRRVPVHPAHGADVARAVMQLVEGRTPLEDFSRIYADRRETKPRVMTLHIRLVSTCLQLEWLFESSVERTRHGRTDLAPSPRLRAH